jgi:hypothetical protein
VHGEPLSELPCPQTIISFNFQREPFNTYFIGLELRVQSMDMFLAVHSRIWIQCKKFRDMQDEMARLDGLYRPY